MLSSELVAPQVCSTYSTCCLLRVTFSQPSFPDSVGKRRKEKNQKKTRLASVAFDGKLVKMRFVTINSPYVAEAQVVSATFVLLVSFYTEAKRMVGSHQLR